MKMKSKKRQIETRKKDAIKKREKGKQDYDEDERGEQQIRGIEGRG